VLLIDTRPKIGRTVGFRVYCGETHRLCLWS